MLLSALVLFAAIECHPLKNVCEAPIKSDSVADSVGVNIHLNYRDTAYNDFNLVRNLLVQLGARHTRDGIVDTQWDGYYQRHVALGRLGIKCLFITSSKQSDNLLLSWPERVKGAFEGFEAPNEIDLSRDPDWPATLKDFVYRLHKIAKAAPESAIFPIIGPSLTQIDSYGKVTGLEDYFDYANMHNYFGGRNPGTPGWGDGGYGSIRYNLDEVNMAWPEKPVITTETGYATDTTVNQGIPESVAGKYFPRMILEQALHGIQRTYIYELIDEGKAVAGTSGAFGLTRMDGSPKPAFTALKNLIARLSDPGPDFTPSNLELSISNSSPQLHHLLCAKRNGSYYLAFWLEEQEYDVNKQIQVFTKPQTFNLVVTRTFTDVDLITFDAEGNAREASIRPDRTLQLSATDSVTLLRLK